MKRLFVWLAILVLSVQPAFAFKAVLTGDSRNDNKGILPAITREASTIPDLAVFIHTGDMTGAGRPDEYSKYKAALRPIQVPVLAVPGNHERKAFGNYLKFVGPAVSTKKIGSWRFIMLDNSTGKLGNAQLGWLQRTLSSAKSNKEHVVIVTHIPLYFTGVDRVMGGKDRQALLKFINDYGVKLVVSGHIHSYCKVVKNGTTYLTTGGAGAPLHGKDSFHHYVLGDLKDDGSFDLEVRKVSGGKKSSHVPITVACLPILLLALFLPARRLRL